MVQIVRLSIFSQFCYLRNVVCDQKSPANPVSELREGGQSMTLKDWKDKGKILCLILDIKKIINLAFEIVPVGMV